MRCRHEHTEQMYFLTDAQWHRAKDIALSGAPHAQKCIRCGEWLSMGTANDASPEVQVELRAAALAADPNWFNKPKYDSESYGALCYHNGGTPGNDDDGGSAQYAADEWAGYLARCIAEHEEG